LAYEAATMMKEVVDADFHQNRGRCATNETLVSRNENFVDTFMFAWSNSASCAALARITQAPRNIDTTVTLPMLGCARTSVWEGANDLQHAPSISRRN